MRDQCRSPFDSKKKKIQLRTSLLHLEEIEARLLPGETGGFGLLAAFNLFGGFPWSLTRPGDESSMPASLVRSPEAAEHTESALIVMASPDQSSPVRLSEHRPNRSESPRPRVADAVFADKGLSDDLINDPLDSSSLFTAARLHGRQTAAPVAGSAVHLDGLADFAQAPPATGSSLPSSTGPVETSNATKPAPAANPPSANATLTGSRGFLHPGKISTADQNGPSWSGYAHDPQHTAISDVPAQPLTGILWQTPVDLNPQYDNGDLLIHYGSPLVTHANTVIVPVKTGAYGDFEVEGFDGGTGALKWTVTTDYSVPSSSWTPPMSLVLTPDDRLYIPGAGGTVYYMANPDMYNATVTGQLAFYGISNHDPSYDSNVDISTPLTSDSQGNIYFGFTVYGPTGLNLQSGIARMDPNGNGSWVAASAAAGDAAISQVVLNCAPALSNDESSLYIAVSNQGAGYLLRLDSTTLNTTGIVPLVDPASGQAARLPNAGTASPTVGPDGDVYYGVLENPFPSNNDRGWLLHFSGDLKQTKIPGAFGWDDTASIVPASMVPSYTGSSSYLLMTKYNNYKDIGSGDGVNKLAVLDPNTMMGDPVTGASVMQEVLTIAGVTPDPVLPQVREWCINTAAVDPATMSILANSEDGTLYRWDMVTNSFTESVNLTSPTGEAYTPTVIGVDGTVYAINNATLFAVI
jgi:hypothetical protein